jgi:hypothetical protein
MSSRFAVHPFPARMAPELVQQRLDDFTGHKIVLDPMMGSGSFVIAAARRGHNAIGIDTDPLAHVITRAAAGQYDRARVAERAAEIIDEIERGRRADFCSDPETEEFVNFWFDVDAQKRLSVLASGIRESNERVQIPLWCAFSRLIITKNEGASRARDVSHSRPHRARDSASFDPVHRFGKSVATVLARAEDGPQKGSVFTMRADTRDLPIPSGVVNGIMTSPPYLIAIDYLRGHRMSLVWMGYSVSELRDLRGTNIGSERGRPQDPELQDVVDRSVSGHLSDRKIGIINRYVSDLDKTVRELARVLRRRGSVTFVVANSMHSSTSVSAEVIVSELADRTRLRLVRREERMLPTSSRYLPPPSKGQGKLDGRMHTEVILKFVKP